VRKKKKGKGAVAPANKSLLRVFSGNRTGRGKKEKRRNRLLIRTAWSGGTVRWREGGKEGREGEGKRFPHVLFEERTKKKEKKKGNKG